MVSSYDCMVCKGGMFRQAIQWWLYSWNNTVCAYGYDLYIWLPRYLDVCLTGDNHHLTTGSRMNLIYEMCTYGLAHIFQCNIIQIHSNSKDVVNCTVLFHVHIILVWYDSFNVHGMIETPILTSETMKTFFKSSSALWLDKS